MSKTDVHTEHCCVHHCKYGYNEEGEIDCTVVSGKLKQSFKCSQIEFCGKLTEEVKAAFAKGEERSYSEDEVKLLVNASCEAVKNEYERRMKKMKEALEYCNRKLADASQRTLDAINKINEVLP